MKKILSLILGIAMLFSLSAIASAAEPTVANKGDTITVKVTSEGSNGEVLHSLGYYLTYDSTSVEYVSGSGTFNVSKVTDGKILVSKIDPAIPVTGFEVSDNEILASLTFKALKDNADGNFNLDFSMSITVKGDVNQVKPQNHVSTDITPLTYIVSFDANGGTGTMADLTVVSGEYTLPACGFTAPTGKQFKGWATTANGDVIEGETYTVTENTTFYAIWEDTPVTTYTVSFNANGGTGTMADVTDVSGAYTLPACEFTAPTGKQFKGWAASANGNVITYLFVTTDITLYAIWEDIPTIPETDDDSFDWSLWYGQLTMLYNQTFKITATASEGGSISPAGSTSVKFNKYLTYTITPDKGYKIESVFVDGKDIGAVDEYTFRSVKKAHTISATFAKVIPFIDVDVDDWFYDDVVFAYENGLMNGDSANTFSPYYGLNRATIVTVLWRLSGSPIVDINASFDDLDTDWYTDAMKWAINKGIILGYGDGTCRPLAEVTHEQISAIFHRYAELCELDTKDAASSISATYSDWAEADVLWAQANGLFDGFGSDLSDLTEIADRAEIAAYIHRFCELIEE